MASPTTANIKMTQKLRGGGGDRDAGSGAASGSHRDGAANHRSGDGARSSGSKSSRSGGLKAWHKVALVPVVLAAAYFAIETWLARKSYVFDTATVAAIANEARAAGGTPEAIMANITATLAVRYPGIVATDTPWLFMRAGGWMGAFKLLYAGVSEYLLLFGAWQRGLPRFDGRAGFRENSVGMTSA